jgi:DNA primase small subunit
MVDKQQGQTEIQFIQEKFKEYYAKNAQTIDPPRAVEKREFGFIPLRKEKFMIRHKKFKNVSQLREFLRSIIPSDVYYSSAYYVEPDQETMDKKNWLGADLVFDVDCDHVPTPCKKEHDRWRCENCGEIGVGQPPEKCPHCKLQKFYEDAWLCEKCLDAAKYETLKLIRLLEEDFGFSDSEIYPVFTGHRGYHIHIEAEIVKKLSSNERKEIVDYVTGSGLKIEFHGFLEGKQGINGPTMTDSGWAGRIARATYTILLEEPEELKSIGLRDDVIKKIVANRDTLIEAWNKGEGWGQIEGIRKKTWEKIVNKALKFEAANIDTVVTTDIHRLIRLASTLHGKTGFKVAALTINRLDTFDPFRDSLAFKDGELTVVIKHSPAIRIGEQNYGPYIDEKVELPMAAAMFFLCKGKAILI